MKQLILYIHGKGGSPAEADHYHALFPKYNVIGLDYQSETPWAAQNEFPSLFDRLCAGYDSVTLIANSIGAYFAMCALSDKSILQAFFISPIVDMERLITDMCTWANVTEKELREKGVIETPFGETLSWEYLSWVRAHPIQWSISTSILCGSRDHLTSQNTIATFANQIHAPLTIMPEGEHWFHTDEQMTFLDNWLFQASY